MHLISKRHVQNIREHLLEDGVDCLPLFAHFPWTRKRCHGQSNHDQGEWTYYINLLSGRQGWSEAEAQQDPEADGIPHDAYVSAIAAALEPLKRQFEEQRKPQKKARHTLLSLSLSLSF